MSGFTIGKLAKATHVRIDTIRFYEKLGLLCPQRRPSGFREYSEQDLERLLFIRRARALGFSLDEISRLLLLETGTSEGNLGCILETHLHVIDQKIDELRSWRSALLKWQRDSEPGAAPDIPSLVKSITAMSGRTPPACVKDCACVDPRAC